MSTAASKRVVDKRPAPKRLVLLFVFALLIGGLVASLSNLWPWSVKDTTAVGHGAGGGVLAGSSGSFFIRGDAAGRISPGVMAPVDLLLTNTQGVTMSVTDLGVTVRRVSAPNADDAHPCVIADFTVVQASPDLKVSLPAHATSALSSLGVTRSSLPAVGMLERSVNQDGCKGASLTLGYAASGTLSQ